MASLAHVPRLAAANSADARGGAWVFLVPRRCISTAPRRICLPEPPLRWRPTTGGIVIELLTATTALALVITKVVDFGRNAFDPARTAPKWLWNVIALVLGLAMALGLEVDMVGDLGISGHAVLVGQVVTGLAIGAAGSGWHEGLDALSQTAKAKKAAAGLSGPGVRVPADAAPLRRAVRGAEAEPV